MLPIFQIIGFLTGAYFLYKTFVLIKQKKETLFEFFLWFGFGLTLIILSIFPGLINYLSVFLGTTKGTNAIFLVSILILFFMNFYVFKMVKTIKHDISKLNEELSILKSEQNEKKNKVKL